jgi:hypothetical protein
MPKVRLVDWPTEPRAPSPPRRLPPPPTARGRGTSSVLVADIGDDASGEELRRAFSRYGPVLRVTIPLDDNGTPRGHGFVEFADRAAAERIVDRAATDPVMLGALALDLRVAAW